MCALCGAPLEVIHPAKVMECDICGRKFTDVIRCSAGHYICENCSEHPGVAVIRRICTQTKSKDPIEIAIAMMDTPVILMHEADHHCVVAAALAAAYKNCGGTINLKEAIDEVIKRGTILPYGICAKTGACGGAVSAGIFYSILAGTKTHSVDEWGEGNRLVAQCLMEISEIGGPRCCKRSTFTSIKIAAEHAEEYFGVKMELPKEIHCKYAKKNRDCLGIRCPYFSP